MSSEMERAERAGRVAAARLRALGHEDAANDLDMRTSEIVNELAAVNEAVARARQPWHVRIWAWFK